MSASDGAAAAASAVAAHMPEGGALSRNLKEALRSRPEVPEEALLRVPTSPLFRLVGVEGVMGGL